jgi:hypothetical protein
MVVPAARSPSRWRPGVTMRSAGAPTVEGDRRVAAAGLAPSEEEAHDDEHHGEEGDVDEGCAAATPTSWKAQDCGKSPLIEGGPGFSSRISRSTS